MNKKYSHPPNSAVVLPQRGQGGFALCLCCCVVQYGKIRQLRDTKLLRDTSCFLPHGLTCIYIYDGRWQTYLQL